MAWGPDYIIACNDVITLWPHRLDAAVSLHGEKIEGWRDKRRENGHPEPDEWVGFGPETPQWAGVCPSHGFPGTRECMSSGIFMARWGFVEMGANRIVLAGVPLDPLPHEHGPRVFKAANHYRETIRSGLAPRYARHIRSMSGWTAEHFGQATEAWANGPPISGKVRR